MKNRFVSLIGIVLFSFLVVNTVNASTTNGTIDTTSKYAWGDYLGWINFGCTNCNVVVTDSVITGYAWSANYGWINLAPTNSGITNDGAGNLSGYAWGENVGWINFNAVSIDSSGVFSGSATTTKLGSINMAPANGGVVTDWRPSTTRPACNNSSDDDGDGLTDYPNDPGCSSLTDTDETDESSGGAFIPPSIPVIGMIGTDEVNFEIKILEGNQVEDKDITLKFTGISNVSQVAISESNFFTGASWEIFASQKSFTLSSEKGLKTLYIKFRSDEGGTSDIYQEKVTLLIGDTQKDDPKVVESTEKPQITESSKEESKKVCSSYNFTSYLTIGHSGDEVRKMQELLEDLGHFTYAKGPTGYFGQVTKDAVVKFQKAKNLSPFPGFVGPGTRKALNESCSKAVVKEEVKPAEKPKTISIDYVFKSYLTIGHSGDEVLKLQQVLEDLGYFEYIHGPTGYFGQVTKTAVIKFQKAKGLSPFPGYVGPGTKKALNSL